MAAVQIADVMRWKYVIDLGKGMEYDVRMATAQPLPDPLDEEIERVLAQNPGLLEELQEWDRRFAAGEVRDDEFVSTEEVRRRLGISPPPP